MKKIELEYILKTSKKIIYSRISTASGLSEWFADNVSINDNVFTFTWDGYNELAKISSKKKEEHVKFSWLDKNKKYFKFTIQKHNHSKEISLLITDFIDDDENIEDAENLWKKQIGVLRRHLGC